LVLDDFENYFNLSLQTVAKDETPAEQEVASAPEPPAILQIAEEQFDVELEPTKKFAPPELTGNTIHDLNRMHPYQVAQAVSCESPVVIAMVVRKLADEHAAKTLEFLPESVRPSIFLKLAQPASVRPIVQQQVLQTALHRALTVEEREIDEESSEKMAKLMRSLPRSVRTPMLDELAKQDSGLAESVKRQLYRFEDLEKLDDRDLQKVLGQCRTDVLVLALQQVEPSLLGRVLGNMSKRAKEALQEEMEYKANAKSDEIEAGRADVLKILVELDESGAISID
jgi:flagellar motor switch protein FliG